MLVANSIATTDNLKQIESASFDELDDSVRYDDSLFIDNFFPMVKVFSDAGYNDLRILDRAQFQLALKYYSENFKNNQDGIETNTEMQKILFFQFFEQHNIDLSAKIKEEFESQCQGYWLGVMEDEEMEYCWHQQMEQQAETSE